MQSKHLTKITASAGTGKTFTLSAYYIAMLLQGKSFRQILAVTFTNKATIEMKERILQYLYALSQGGQGEDHFIEKVQQYQGLFGTPLSREEICEQSGRYFRQMMADFDNIHITTIDSFLQVLLSGLAQTIGEHAGFSIELDTEKVIQEAVKRLMTTTMQQQKDFREALIADLKDKLSKEMDWDIRKQLAKLGNELFRESVQVNAARITFDLQRIDRFREAVAFSQTDCYRRIEQAWRYLHQHENELAKVTDQKSYCAFVHSIEPLFKGRRMTSKMYTALAARAANRLTDGSFSGADALRDALQVLVDGRDDFMAQYLLWSVTTEQLDKMRLLSYLMQQIHQDMSEENTLLLGETANTLKQSLATGDADFILEKAGLRYRHILLDEFQDTSELQWSNFRTLIEEVLASGGTALVVGDIKQSIYRFRNGNWTIMASINEQHPTLGAHCRIEPLHRNFRSQKAVVQFNLETFQRITSPDKTDNSYAEWRPLYNENYTPDTLHQYHRADKQGGYVQLRFYPYTTKRINSKDLLPREELYRNDYVRDRIADDLFDTISQLLAAGAQPEEMLVLVRDGRDADLLVQHHQQRQQAQPDSPLSRVSLTTPKSFRMESSVPVRVIIHTMRALIRKDQVSEAWLQKMGYADALKELRQTISADTMPLYILVQEILHRMLCTADGCYPGKDEGVAYLHQLVDEVRLFVAKKGSDIEAFMDYWDETLAEKAIPTAAAGSIRIMTIHASKGLEAKHLFIPFCGWEMEDDREKFLWCRNMLPADDDARLDLVPIRFSSQLQQTPYAPAYEEEHRQQRLDNLNLLYVALTRAADNLFVCCPIDVHQPLPDATCLTAGTLLADAWQQAEAVRAFFDTLDDLPPDAPAYLPFTPYGEQPQIVADRKDKSELFDFGQAERIRHLDFASDNHLLRFHATSESERTMQRLGNICHAILAQVRVRGEEKRIIESFYRRGTITSPEQRQQVEQLIAGMWTNPTLCDWFSDRWQLLREDTFLLVEPDEHGEACMLEKRMDRVMIAPDTHEAIVLDFKFGQLDNRKYKRQVERYKRILAAMHYTSVRGYLWMAQEQRLVEVGTQQD